MSKPSILIIGAGGQLGKEIRVVSDQYSSYSFIFTTKEELDIRDADKVQRHFDKYHPAFCINCAAYTAVDKAETEKELAFAINADATGTLARISAQAGTKFVHISTDYVFDGTSRVPYKEDDQVGPQNVYGASKLKGEELCRQFNDQSIIIRTAWVYSAFGNNFVKTMLRLMKERTEINVVNDQVGAPTYAVDLAKCILDILGEWQPGTYHYSNRGKVSWFDFAMAIKELTRSACTLKPIPSSQYPTPAKRPSFSLLDTTKIRETFRCNIPDWKYSLANCLRRL